MALVAEVEDGDDVGVIHRGGGARFLGEAVEAVAIRRKRGAAGL